MTKPRPPALRRGASCAREQMRTQLDVVLDVRDERTGAHVVEMLNRMKKGAKEVSLTGVGVVGASCSRTRLGLRST